MDIDRRQFNLSVLGAIGSLPLMAGISLAEDSAFSESDIQTITGVVAGFSLKWGGEPLDRSLIHTFMEAKLAADVSNLGSYKKVCHLYNVALGMGLSPVEAVDKILETANTEQSDKLLRRTLKEILTLYVTQSGFASYGLKNIDGYISSGYLDTPTPYRVA